MPFRRRKVISRRCFQVPPRNAAKTRTRTRAFYFFACGCACAYTFIIDESSTPV